MSILIDEIIEIASELQQIQPFKPKEALKLAVEIQRNRILIDAFVLHPNTIGSLEAIAMQLGQEGSKYSNDSIKSALYAIAGKNDSE